MHHLPFVTHIKFRDIKLFVRDDASGDTPTVKLGLLRCAEDRIYEEVVFGKSVKNPYVRYGPVFRLCNNVYCGGGKKSEWMRIEQKARRSDWTREFMKQERTVERSQASK